MPVRTALLVPHRKTQCANAILNSSGAMLQAMILSSLKSFSVLIYRPINRAMMMVRAKAVHHHDTSKPGFLVTTVCAFGGLE